MASANNMVSPVHNWRPSEAYAPNGSHPKAHSADFAQLEQPRKDIGEKGIDPEVHGMASANNMVSPVHNWRSPEPWAPNGSHPKAHSADFAQLE